MRAEKLYQKLLGGSRNVRFEELCSVAKAFGYRLNRISGSHHIFEHARANRPLNLRATMEKRKRTRFDNFFEMWKNLNSDSKIEMMNDYHINVFYSEEDGGYIADIPDLKSCSAFGETPEEAVLQVQIAKIAWLETCRATQKPIPKPAYRTPIFEFIKS